MTPLIKQPGGFFIQDWHLCLKPSVVPLDSIRLVGQDGVNVGKDRGWLIAASGWFTDEYCTGRWKGNPISWVMRIANVLHIISYNHVKKYCIIPIVSNQQGDTWGIFHASNGFVRKYRAILGMKDDTMGTWWYIVGDMVENMIWVCATFGYKQAYNLVGIEGDMMGYITKHVKVWWLKKI